MARKEAAGLLVALDALLRPRAPAWQGPGRAGAASWPALRDGRPRARNEVLEDAVLLVWKLVSDGEVRASSVSIAPY